MSAKDTIVLNTVSYYPGQNLAPGWSAWYNRPDGSNPAMSILSQNVRKNGNGKQIRAEHRLTMPTGATEASACACPGGVLRETYAVVTAQVAVDATQSEKVDFLARLREYVASDVFGDTVLHGLGGAAY